MLNCRRWCRVQGVASLLIRPQAGSSVSFPFCVLESQLWPAVGAICSCGMSKSYARYVSNVSLHHYPGNDIVFNSARLASDSIACQPDCKMQILIILFRPQTIKKQSIFLLIGTHLNCEYLPTASSTWDRCFKFQETKCTTRKNRDDADQPDAPIA